MLPHGNECLVRSFCHACIFCACMHVWCIRSQPLRKVHTIVTLQHTAQAALAHPQRTRRPGCWTERCPSRCLRRNTSHETVDIHGYRRHTRNGCSTAGPLPTMCARTASRWSSSASPSSSERRQTTMTWSPGCRLAAPLRLMCSTSSSVTSRICTHGQMQQAIAQFVVSANTVTTNRRRLPNPTNPSPWLRSI